MVALAVYCYFLASLLGNQWMEDRTEEESLELVNKDYYFPFFASLQFIFYMGWLKVIRHTARRSTP